LEDKLHVLQMTGYILAITQKEITSLLATNQSLWAECVKRGKGILRQRQGIERKAKPQSERMKPL
jgi:hypothetical protein